MAERRFFTDIILGSANMQISFGAGNPESVITADVGSLYLRNNATDASDSFWVKNSGSGNTGWRPVATIPSGADTGDILFMGSDGNLEVNSANNLFWDNTNNRLGINEDNPNVALHIFSNTSGQPKIHIQTTSTSNNPAIQFQWDGTGTRRSTIQGAAVSSFATPGLGSATEIQFYTRNSSGTFAQRMILDQNGDLNLNAGNELRLWNTTGWTGGNYIGLAAGASADGKTYLLPSSVGTNGQYLELDNASTGQLVWSSISSISSLDELDDVDAAFAEDGDVLVFQGGSVNEWKASAAPFVSIEGLWATATSYERGNVTSNDGILYLCIWEHTSAANTEPGIGANWIDYWDRISTAERDMVAADEEPIGYYGSSILYRYKTTYTVSGAAATKVLPALPRTPTRFLLINGSINTGGLKVQLPYVGYASGDSFVYNVYFSGTFPVAQGVSLTGGTAPNLADGWVIELYLEYT